jgi:DNA-binding CsgD family transcriptional regulator
VIDPSALKAAADEFTASALLGNGWEQSLALLARAADADGIALMCNQGHRLAAVIHTASIAEPVADFLAGRTPPLSRQVRVPADSQGGFRVDFDDFSADSLLTDPYYQEFLRPRGYFWHANATIARDDGDSVELSLKRRIVDGPYEAHDIALLNIILPDLRLAARVARQVFDAHGAGMVALMHSRGDAVFELDSWGRVMRVHAFDDTQLGPIRIVGRRLVVADATTQRAIDRATAEATGEPGHARLVALRGDGQERYVLHIVRVAGRARDVFMATAAVAVLLRLAARENPQRLDRGLIREAFMLTDRETSVAVLLGEGMSIDEIARLLGLQIATLRSYLKSIFEKTGTTRQAQLVSLIGKLRP